MTQRNAAGQIWPNLKSDQRPEQAQRAQPSLAGAMYPRQTAEQREWDARRERDRQSLLKHLREANARIDARLGKR